MSNRLLNLVFGCREFHGATRLVLLSIADRISDETGECWSTYDDLQRRCNLRRQAVAMGLREGRESGVLKAKRQRNGPTYYSLNAELLESLKIKLARSDFQTERSLIGVQAQFDPTDANHPEPSLNPPKNHRRERDTKSSARSKATTQEAASQIYDLYPRKIGKRAALTAIMRAMDRLVNGNDEPPIGRVESLDDAIAFLRDRTQAFADSPAGRAGKYCPHPATFYNQSRFLDGPEEWVAHGKDKAGNNDRFEAIIEEVAQRYS